MQKFILLGASRGLGWETFIQLAAKNPENKFLLSSRKIAGKESEVSAISPNTRCLAQDFSRTIQSEYLSELKHFDADCLVYFAGGGPYGIFQGKKWSDHEWALRTSFLYPAELVHSILANRNEWAGLKKIVLIGSAIAEAAGDPQAASYAAAKHALKGLVDSVNAEQKPDPAVLLFSPGYMQTDLLPAKSGSQAALLAESPTVVAERLIHFIEKTERKS